jgi:DNA polymerase sigma
LNNNFNNNFLYESQFLLHHNPLIYLFDNLNNDISNLISEQEVLLNYLHQIKIIIYEFLREITNKIYPNSKLEIYGSSLYKLDIECSDLDLCISSKDKICFSLLIKELTNNYFNIFDNIFPILSASVPVIKLVINPLKLNNEQINSIYYKIHYSEYYKNYIFDKKEIDKIRIDITINAINHKQIKFIQKSLINYPYIKDVIKILKRCLCEKNMNQTYKGGMSSYVLFLLIYSFTKWNVITNNKIDSPGELLIDFLFYYTTVIDFNQILINAKLNNPFIFCYNLESIPTILDPVTMNNAAKSVFKIFDIIQIFNIIYRDIYLINKKISEDSSNEKKKNIIKILFENLLNKKNN